MLPYFLKTPFDAQRVQISPLWWCQLFLSPPLYACMKTVTHPLIFSADPNFTYTVLNREKFRMETITNRVPDDDLHALFFVQGAVFDWLKVLRWPRLKSLHCNICPFFSFFSINWSDYELNCSFSFFLKILRKEFFPWWRIMILRWKTNQQLCLSLL